MSQKDFTKEVASKSSRKSNSKIQNHLLIFLKTEKHASCGNGNASCGICLFLGGGANLSNDDIISE